MPRSPLLLALGVALGAASALLPAPCGADPAEAVRVPRAEGLVLDGRMDEGPWALAARLPVEPVEVPVRRGEPATRRVEPQVRLLLQEGELWIAVRIPEDAGLATGVKGLVALPGAATAADALSFAFVPQDVGSPRWTVRGPRGVGRGVYRLRGAADLSDPAASGLEVVLPLADLPPPPGAGELRLAVVVATRTREAVGWAPPAAKLAAPARWAPLAPPDGAWGGSPGPDAAPLAAEDAKDEERMAAWRRFLAGRLQPPPNGSREEVLAFVRQSILDPLDAVLAARPDLAFPHVLKADVYRQLGMDDEAMAEARLALGPVPGLREALFVWMGSWANRYAEGKPDQPSDYAAALARLDAASADLRDPIEGDGAALARGLLLFKRGDFAEARALLEPLARRYPFFPPAVENASRAAAYADHWADERQYRARDEAKGDLPRVRIDTSQGPVLLELFEDDAPNTVRNFLWLADHDFYDGLAFHRNVPFFVAQGGDPLSKDPAKAALVGGGGPCYAIATEPSRRKPFRGVIAMARSQARDTEGSQFFLTTGTSAHLEGEYSVFGRVLEGQEAVDRLVAGDRILGVEVVRRRPGTTYRPVTTAGQPAPDPKPCGPGARG